MTRPAGAGRVAVVGAGPGDPGLLTVRGARCLQEADVVVYGELPERRFLDLVPTDCQRVYLGPRDDRSCPSPEETAQLLVQHARQGRRVVRLHGGDPCIFGRGAEEALALAAAGVTFELVPGVSAASAVPACAGIPLTHRGLAATVVLVSAHQGPADLPPAVDWPLLARLDATLVIFAGVGRLAQIAAALLTHGRPADTPAAVIQRGTCPGQRTVSAPLHDVARAAAAAGIESPALVVIGPVARLREQLAWFERRPLYGRRVLVTRQADQAGELVDGLEQAGARVDVLPLLELGWPEDCRPLDAALARLADFGWVVFTSPNAAEYFWTRLRHTGADARALGGARLAAVGATTAASLERCGLCADLVPTRASQEGLVEALAAVRLAGCQVLIPGSSLARTRLDDALQAQGATVVRVTAYANRPPDAAAVVLPECLWDGEPDVVVFASPSAANNLAAVLGPERAHQVLDRAAVAVIGPTTAQAVEALGHRVAVQPETSSVAALVEAICRHFAGAS